MRMDVRIDERIDMCIGSVYRHWSVDGTSVTLNFLFGIIAVLNVRSSSSRMVRHSGRADAASASACAEALPYV